jgi:Tol biopolymer transport system component
VRFAPPIEEQPKNRRSRWLALALVTMGVATLVVALLLLRTDGRTAEQGPASTPPPSATTTSAEGFASTPQPPHPFADIQGWIAYGDYNGIWAIDPTHAGRPKLIRNPIRLSYESALPVAWSQDGSKLLIVRPFLESGGQRRVAVSILNADGVEKRVVRLNGYFGFASLSPDGSQIVYSTFDSGIYLANAEGGDIRLLLSRHRRWYASEKKSFRTELFAATFSADGHQIGYVDGMGDWGNSIRVMGADGSHVRVLVDWRRGPGRQREAMDNHVYRLAWSPDGSRLAFDTDDGIWVVGSDGSGLRMMIRHGHNPTWSPDGSRLAYATWNEQGTCCAGRLRIADADGSHVQTFAHIDIDPESGWSNAPGPWNPLQAGSG